MNFRDPCGICCFIFIYGIIGYCDFALIYWVLIPASIIPFTVVASVLFNVCLLMLISSHLRCVFTNPGYVISEDMNVKSNQCNPVWTYCDKCKLHRPPRAHHCKLCARCVNKMDHHCPWVANCVGLYNQRAFIQFLFHTVLTTVVGIIILLIVLFIGLRRRDEEGINSDKFPQTALANSIIVGVFCAVFFLFAISMLFDQTQAILKDETAVEHVKRSSAAINSHSSIGNSSTISRKQSYTLDSFRRVCGYAPVLCWLFPCTQVEYSMDSCWSVNPNSTANVTSLSRTTATPVASHDRHNLSHNGQKTAAPSSASNQFPLQSNDAQSPSEVPQVLVL